MSSWQNSLRKHILNKIHKTKVRRAHLWKRGLRFYTRRGGCAAIVFRLKISSSFKPIRYSSILKFMAMVCNETGLTDRERIRIFFNFFKSTFYTNVCTTILCGDFLNNLSDASRMRMSLITKNIIFIYELCIYLFIYWFPKNKVEIITFKI